MLVVYFSIPIFTLLVVLVLAIIGGLIYWHFREIEKLKADHQEEIDDLRTRYDSRIISLQDELQQERDTHVSTYSTDQGVENTNTTVYSTPSDSPALDVYDIPATDDQHVFFPNARIITTKASILKNPNQNIWNTKTGSTDQVIILVLPDGGTVILPQGARLVTYRQKILDLADQITSQGQQACIEYFPSGYINP